MRFALKNSPDLNEQADLPPALMYPRQNYLGASIFWIRRIAALGGEVSAISDWRRKRDGTLRGIVEVLHD